MTSDCLGANALAAFYYSADMDALQQIEYLKGQDVWCNPPFSRMADFIKLCEDTFSANSQTRIVLVAPLRTSHLWSQHLNQSRLWQLVAQYQRG